MVEAAVVRALAFYVPLGLVAGAAAVVRPDRRHAGAALLAGLWNLTALLAVNVFAAHAGWWRFGTVGGELAGVPVDVWFGWTLLWGALPALLPEGVPGIAVVCALAWVDLALMPLGSTVVRLGPHWLLGEGLAMGAALVPGLVLARLTASRRFLAVRVGLQVVLFGGLLGVVTAALLAASRGWWTAPDLRRPAVQLGAEAVALLGVPALAAVAELARRGGGTPFPFDPPTRLVTTGPYAYVANPMQLSMTLVLVGSAALLRSWPVLALAVVAAAFSAGIAGWHEDVELAARFGPAWPRYRGDVRTWLPRSRPLPPDRAAILYLAPGCAPCQGVGRWLTDRRPSVLDIRPATDSPWPLRRLTYVGADGLLASGVAGFARALGHVHLGWAFLGWVLLLPGLGRFVQLVVDAVGGGRLAEPIGGSVQRAA